MAQSSQISSGVDPPHFNEADYINKDGFNIPLLPHLSTLSPAFLFPTNHSVPLSTFQSSWFSYRSFLSSTPSSFRCSSSYKSATKTIKRTKVHNGKTGTSTEIIRSRKIAIKINRSLRTHLNLAYYVTRSIYNECVYLCTRATPSHPVNHNALRKLLIVSDYPGWSAEKRALFNQVPADIRHEAIKDFCKAFEITLDKVKQGIIPQFRMHFRSRKYLAQESIVIRGRDFKDVGVGQLQCYPLKWRGGLIQSFSDRLPSSQFFTKSVRLIRTKENKYYIALPLEIKLVSDIKVRLNPIIPKAPLLPSKPIIPKAPLLPSKPIISSLPSKPIIPKAPLLPSKPIISSLPLVNKSNESNSIDDNKRKEFKEPMRKEKVLKGNAVALDPGVRIFQTTYDTEGNSYLIGENGAKKLDSLAGIARRMREGIYRYYKDGKSFSKKFRKAKNVKEKKGLLKAANHIEQRIKNMINDIHRKSAKFLCEKYDTIIIPEFASQEMVKNVKRKIGKSTARQLLRWSHYKFRELLKCKGEVMGSKVIIGTEEYTSKTCGNCFYINKHLSGQKMLECRNCKIKIHRDINGARNILMLNWDKAQLQGSL